MEAYVPRAIAGIPQSDLDMHIMHLEGEFPPPFPYDDPEEEPNSPEFNPQKANASPTPLPPVQPSPERNLPTSTTMNNVKPEEQTVKAPPEPSVPRECLRPLDPTPCHPTSPDKSTSNRFGETSNQPLQEAEVSQIFAGAAQVASLSEDLPQSLLDFDIDEAFKSMFPSAIPPEPFFGHAPWSDPDISGDNFNL